MIECPNCQHQEFVGTLFCGECGTRLIHVSTAPDMAKHSELIDHDTVTTRPAVPEGPELESGAFLGLRVVNTGEVISLIGRDNYTLGRSGKDQAVIPDVDLLPHNAFDHGVSRIHAEIQLKPDGLFIIDLDSANSTFVNGKRMVPQEPYPVRHGDVIELGGLRLQLISRFRL
ncbi:MAG: FHA domain-containing protein [Anaerolineales bacterium]|nr:FHA domain-containing protein [Anaerolineales bacterium]